MALLHRDTTHNELFITPIRGLYDEYAMSIEEFKDKNAGIIKNRWLDTSHGDNGEKIYELYNPGEQGEIIKESLQEWLCDNRFEITSSIAIALRNHERSYADWFRYIEDMSGPDELALYSLSRKHGIHTAVFNKTYVWTTLMNHINVPDEEIIENCGVNLVFLGPCKYGIIKNIRTPQPQSTKPPPTSSKRTAAKVTCRNSSSGKKSARGKSAVAVAKPSTSKTLSSSRQQNYGINPTSVPRVSKRHRPPINYLTLNDGLEEDAPVSPKHQKRGANRPKSEPSTRRLWAERQMGSPKSDATLSGILTMDLTTPQPSTSLVGIQPAESTGERTLTGVQPGDTLPDIVLNRPDTTTTSGEQELNAANILLSLGDSIEPTQDVMDDNADLMPIGGGSNAPIDVAPVPLRLDQTSVDAAIAGIVQSEELPPPTLASENTSRDNPPATKTTDDAPTKPTTDDADPDDDLPLSVLAKKLESQPVKGTLQTKTYKLKKKADSNRSFKCPACETWKLTVQRLNAHYKR